MRTLLLLLPLSLLFAQSQGTIDPARGLTLANRAVRLEFEPSGMGLKAMIDVATGRNHIDTVTGKHLLWQLKMGKGTLAETLDNNYKPCSYAHVDTLADGTQRALLEWNQMRWWKEDRALTVRVTIELPPDSGIARWRIAVDNHSDYWGLRNATFPAVSGFPASGAYDIARPVFASGGSLLKKRTTPVGDRHPSGFWPMQFCSLHRGSDSVYLGTLDSEGRAKNFLIEPGKQLSVVHHPENLTEAGSGWQDYYPVEFGVFQGSWVEAAHHYRAWALHQKWASAGLLSKRPMPAMAKNASFWLRDRWLPNVYPGGKPAPADIAPLELNRPILDALDQMGVPAGLHWYNWHQVPYDNLYPRFLPAKKGFAERVQQLVSRGVLVMPYINGCSADLSLPDWDKFAPYANVDESGGYRLHYYSDTAGRLLGMCPSQSFWQGTIERLADDLFTDLKVNALYVDQISAMEHELCFSSTHGHPRGGGRYWADGNREVLRRVHNAAHRGGRDIAITSEGADELFLDLVDANLTWAPPSADEIPMMETVYSGYTLFFGSPCDYKQSDRFFRYAQGQALIDGRQNGWMDSGLFDGTHETKAGYLKECVRIHAAQHKYLTFGRLLQPVEPIGAVPRFSEKVFGWERKETGEVPGAEARLWEAEDGSRAIFFANYSDEEIRFRYRLPVAGAKEQVEVLPAGAIRVVEVKR